MTDGIHIKGGAGEFEAAVIAVVLDQIAVEEKHIQESRPEPNIGVSRWMRAIHPEEPDSPLDNGGWSPGRRPS